MKALVVIVIWNNALDAIACLESLSRSEGSFDVVLSDNGSSDGSLERLTQWSPKFDLGSRTSSDRSLHILENGKNLGYAGGVNAALRWGLTFEYDYFWILNADTEVDKKALNAQIAVMSTSDRIGVVGSKVCYADNRDILQCCGGARFLPWRAAGKYIGHLGSADTPPEPSVVNAELDYILGASMLVSRALLERIGLMSEEYFLYFEEIDWAMRYRPQFDHAYAQDSIVFHKHGASIGRGRGGGQSRASSVYFNRSRVKFTRNFYPHFMATVLLWISFDAIRMAVRGRFGDAWAVLRAAMAESFVRTGK